MKLALMANLTAALEKMKVEKYISTYDAVYR